MGDWKWLSRSAHLPKAGMPRCHPSRMATELKEPASRQGQALPSVPTRMWWLRGDFPRASLSREALPSKSRKGHGLGPREQLKSVACDKETERQGV